MRLLLNGKLVAELDRHSRTLIKRIVASKHMLQVPLAIAIDACLYDRWRQAFDTIRVEDKESGAVYWCSADHFDKWRITIDRGHGRQYALPLQKWCNNNTARSSQSQLDLFEEEKA